MRGMEDPHDIEIAMDGQRLTLVTAGGRDQISSGWPRTPARSARTSIDNA